MKRLLAVLAASALLSCQSSDPGAAVAPEGTGGIALRVQADSPLRKVDSVKVVLSYKQNQATVTVGDSVPWDRSGVKLTGLPLEVSIRVRMEAWESARGRRLVYWTAETTTTLSKNSPAWDFTDGVQTVPVRVAMQDTAGYIGPALGQVAIVPRGQIVEGVLRLVASAGNVDSVLFDPLKVDSVYLEGAPVPLEAGMFRVRMPGADTLDLTVVGRNGLTSLLRIEVAAPPPPVVVAGLGARWVAPTPASQDWVGAQVPLAVRIDSGKVDSVVVRFAGSPSLHLVRDDVDSSFWSAVWEPAAGSTQGEWNAYAVGGTKEFALPQRLVHVDLAKPEIQPLTFRKDSVFRVGAMGRDLEFKVVDQNLSGLVVWGAGAGGKDSLVPTPTAEGYRLHAVSSLVLHARDRLGNQSDLPVAVVLDTVGPVLSRLLEPGGADLQPGTGAVETTTGQVSLTALGVSDSAGVSDVWATKGTDTATWDRQSKILALSGVGTWTVHATDFLGNESVWGTVLVRYPAPAKPPVPTVTPASGVYGADSLKWGAGADTLVPTVTCTQGTAQVQVDGKPWRDFRADQEYWALAGGEAKASYRCKTVSDSSDPVARTWVLLHEPFLTYGGPFYDSIRVRVARNGTLPNGSLSTNPASAGLELCAGDSAACAVPGAVWVGVPEKDTVLRTGQNLTARLAMRDAATNRDVYSRTLTRSYQRLMSDRVDWSFAWTKNADAAWLKSQFGVVDSGTATTSRTLKTVDTTLELSVTWGSLAGRPYAWVDLPFDADGRSWNLESVTSIGLQFSGADQVGGVSLNLLSDAYPSGNQANGKVFQTTLEMPVAGSTTINLTKADFAYASWVRPVPAVGLDEVWTRATGLRLQLDGPLDGGGSATLRIHKIVVKGTMTRVAN